MKAVWVLTKLYVQGIWVVYLFNLCCHPNTKDINQKHKGNSSHWWNIVFKTHHFDELLVLIDLHHRQRKPFKGNASFLDINDKAKSLEVDNFLSSLTIYPHIAHLFLIPQGWMVFVFFFSPGVQSFAKWHRKKSHLGKRVLVPRYDWFSMYLSIKQTVPPRPQINVTVNFIK